LKLLASASADELLKWGEDFKKALDYKAQVQEIIVKAHEIANRAVL
jgi:hypothetical protein